MTSAVDGRCVRESMNMEHWSEGSDRGKPKYSALKSVQMSLFSAQTLNELACNGTLASGVVFHLSLCRICGVTSDNTTGALCICQCSCISLCSKFMFLRNLVCFRIVQYLPPFRNHSCSVYLQRPTFHSFINLHMVKCAVRRFGRSGRHPAV